MKLILIILLKGLTGSVNGNASSSHSFNNASFNNASLSSSKSAMKDLMHLSQYQQAGPNQNFPAAHSKQNCYQSHTNTSSTTGGNKFADSSNQNLAAGFLQAAAIVAATAQQNKSSSQAAFQQQYHHQSYKQNMMGSKHSSMKASGQLSSSSSSSQLQADSYSSFSAAPSRPVAQDPNGFTAASAHPTQSVSISSSSNPTNVRSPQQSLSSSRQVEQAGTNNQEKSNEFEKAESPKLNKSLASRLNDSFQFIGDENNNISKPAEASKKSTAPNSARQITGSPEATGDAETIDEVLANAAASLVSSFLNENLLNSSGAHLDADKASDSILLMSKDAEDECRAGCASPGSVSIITLSSDGEQDRLDQEDSDELYDDPAFRGATFHRHGDEEGEQEEEEDFFKEIDNANTANNNRQHAGKTQMFTENETLGGGGGNKSTSIKKERLSIEQFQSMQQPLNLSFNNEGSNAVAPTSDEQGHQQEQEEANLITSTNNTFNEAIVESASNQMVIIEI